MSSTADQLYNPSPDSSTADLSKVYQADEHSSCSSLPAQIFPTLNSSFYFQDLFFNFLFFLLFLKSKEINSI